MAAATMTGNAAKEDGDTAIIDHVKILSSYSALAGPKRNLGRSARRRRKKLMEIQKLENQFLRRGNQISESISSEHHQQHNNEVVPSDRSRIWPGVKHCRQCLATSLNNWTNDAAMLQQQLGYVPGNAICVAARIKNIPLLVGKTNFDFYQEEPVVVQLYPIAIRDEHVDGAKTKFKQRKRKRQKQRTQEQQSNNSPEKEEDGNGDVKGGKVDYDFVIEPFPTLYWLTHPLLRTLVSKLELQSKGIQYEQRLKNEQEALDNMTKAHLAYGHERQSLLSETDQTLISQRNWQRAFDTARGVAGIRNYASVKCLHAHVAHFLSTGPGSCDNIIGQWVMEDISQMLDEACQAVANRSDAEVATDASEEAG